MTMIRVENGKRMVEKHIAEYALPNGWVTTGRIEVRPDIRLFDGYQVYLGVTVVAIEEEAASA